jgi:putative glutathione S-transferase
MGRRVAQFPGEQSRKGEFRRQEDAFRDWISADESTEYPAAAGRYHLYVSLACPWASRTVIARKLLGLEEVIGITVVDPVRDERGWAFRDPSESREEKGRKRLSKDHTAKDESHSTSSGQGPVVPPTLVMPNKDNIELLPPSTDPVNGFHFLAEAYVATDPNFKDRATVPALWDKERRRIVNNSEDDICRMFNNAFRGPARNQQVDLFPADIADEHEKLSAFIYDDVNNGVYKAGFTTRQHVYEVACRKLFDALDQLEERLTKSRFLFGTRIVEADWRLFCTLIRFDAVYYSHFKCNLRRILDYPSLHGYLLDLYQQPGIAETVNMDHIKRHYYMTHDRINPTRIVPIGPELHLMRPHGREKFN